MQKSSSRGRFTSHGSETSLEALERAASLHLDTLATLASKGSPLQPSVTPDTVAQHFSEPIAAERAVAV